MNKVNKDCIEEEIFIHIVPVELTCEKCGKAFASEVEFSNCVKSTKEAFQYEYGEDKDQKGKYLWTCDCGGSMIAKAWENPLL